MANIYFLFAEGKRKNFRKSQDSEKDVSLLKLSPPDEVSAQKTVENKLD